MTLCLIEVALVKKFHFNALVPSTAAVGVDSYWRKLTLD